MARHVAFGVRTGGSVVILGTLLVMLAVFFSGSVEMLFRLFPTAVLGVILLLTGPQLSLGSAVYVERGGGLLFGIALYHLNRHSLAQI